MQLTAREDNRAISSGYWVGIGPAPSYAKGSSELSNPNCPHNAYPARDARRIAASWLPCFLRCQLFRCYGVYGGSKTLYGLESNLSANAFLCAQATRLKGGIRRQMVQELRMLTKLLFRIFSIKQEP